MARIDNISSGEFAALMKRVRALEVATPLAHASIGRGRLRLYDGSELLIEDGNLTISGTGDVTGTLNVTGILNADGTITFTGTTNLDGPTHIDGNTDITGTLAVKGATTLSSTLTVNSPGKITVNGTIPATLSDGRLSFSTGGVVKGYSDGLVLVANETSGAAIQLTGSAVVIAGGLSNPAMPLITGKTPNVYIDSAGKLWRTS